MTAFYKVYFEAANNEDLSQIFSLSDDINTPIDLTGADLRMDIENSDGNDVLNLSLANGKIELINALSGQFKISIPAATMQTLPPGVYNHDLIMTNDGLTQRIWQGTLSLTPGITQ